MLKSYTKGVFGAQSRHSAIGFFSSRPNWDSPTPSPQASMSLPLWFSGRTYSLAGEGVGGPNSDEGTDTVGGTLGIYVLSGQVRL